MNGRAARRPRRLLDVLLVAGTLLVLVPVAEIVVRVVAPRTLPSQEFLRGFVLKDMYTADERAGYRLTPSFSGTIRRGDVVTTFSTNSLGLRAPEIGSKERPRILAFGDSFTWGWGVAQGEEWIAVAGRELGCEAINCGVNGYGTENELALLERVGPELSPDLVLVGFFANDYTDNLLGAKGIYTVRDGYLFDRFSHEWFEESFLARESHLYRLVAQAWDAARVRWLGGPPSSRPVRQFSQAEFRRGMELSAKHIVAMRDRARALGAAFGVVWLPADVYALSRKSPRDIPLQEELKARVARHGIPSIDLLSVVTREPDPSALYLKGDGHFSALGNAVAGRAVARWITERGLLP
jgi:lysophospholipase L1-like esterase